MDTQGLCFPHFQAVIEKEPQSQGLTQLPPSYQVGSVKTFIAILLKVSSILKARLVKVFAKVTFLEGSHVTKRAPEGL